MRMIFYCSIVWTSFSAGLTACASSADDGTGQAADSTIHHRQRMPSRTTWEEIAFFPGRMIYIPLKYSLRGLNWGVGFVDDSRIIPQISDLLNSDDERRGVMPTYSARTGGGLDFYQTGLFVGGTHRNILLMTATVGLYERQRYELNFYRLEVLKGLIYSNLWARYRKLTTESFFGIGPDSPFSGESDFTQEQTSAGVNFGHNLTSRLAIGADLGYEHTNITDGRDPDLPSTLDIYTGYSLPGLDRKVEMMNLMFTLKMDSRDRPGNPTRGCEASLYGGIYNQIDGDEFGFTKYGLDFSKYIHLFYERVLVLRIAGESTDSFDDGSIPFCYLSELGRKETIRGFRRGRFRDRDMILASAEYRYPVWKNWNEYGSDFILFADAGQVSPDLINRAAMNKFAAGLGFGFRFWNQKGLMGKIEAGKSDDGWRIYFVLH